MTGSSTLDRDFLLDQTMNSMLERRAAARGQAPFVTYGEEDRTYTYAETNAVANRIGNSLVDLGVSPQETVSVMASTPLDLIISMFGINKAGAIFSPINAQYKGEPLRHQLEDVRPAVVIVEDTFVDRLNDISQQLSDPPHVVIKETGGDVPSLHDAYDRSPFAELRCGQSNRPEVDLHWSDPAGILYTSGTTGKPKGVVLAHRWIFGNYNLVQNAILNEDDVVHTSLPFYHVSAVYSKLAGTLAAGARIVVWDKFSSSQFWDRVERYNATSTTLISVMIPWLANAPERDDDRYNTLNKVRMAPIPDNYQAIAERYGFEFVGTNYGSTETGCPVAAFIQAATGEDATPPELRFGSTGEEIRENAAQIGLPILDDVPDSPYVFAGRQLDGVMDVRVHDEDDERAPPGEPGELVVRPKAASLVFREYHDRAEQTVEAFRNLWFHTGDVGMRDESGNYYFVDRMGSLIRRRGENISSMQVEEIVGGHPAISQAAAFPVAASEGGEDEVAVAVTVAEDSEVDESGLRSYFEAEMPEFMVPTHLFFVEDIPQTDTNKVELPRLKEMVLESPAESPPDE